MTAPAASPRMRATVAALACLLGGVHVALVNYYQPLAWLTSPEPITGVDFDTHAEQTWRVLEGLLGWGKSWVYDVQLLAGFPNGTIFDADNKLWELWTYALHQMGVPKAAAFNSFVFLAHVLVVPWLFLAARVFGLGAGASLLAAALGSMLWFFDSYAHWFFWIGTVAYIFAAYYYVLPLALFYRWSRDRKPHRVVLVAVLMAIGHLLHPYSFFVMVLPMVVIYASVFRALTRAQHASVVGIAVFVVLVNAYWLIVSIEHWHYILNSAFFGQSHSGFVVADFFNLLIDASTTGYIGTRTGVRWLCFVAAACSIWCWRKAGDPRSRLFGLSLIWMFFLAYVAPVLIPPVRQIQPYRFVASAMFLATIPAADLFQRLWRERTTWFREWNTRLIVLVLAVPAFQHIATDVLYFMPELLPSVPKVADAPFPISASGYMPHFGYRHLPPGAIDTAVDEFIDEHAHEGRFAVPDWTGERYAWSTRGQILGGFVDLNMSHAQAHPARWTGRHHFKASELREYIDTYAVRYFVVRFGNMGLANHPDIVEPYREIGGVTIYRTLQPVSFFAEGAGEVSAQTNRIVVRGTNPATPIRLKYHWHEALVCKPDCRIERVVGRRDEVGFIRIPAPHPSSFVIENSYRM